MSVEHISVAERDSASVLQQLATAYTRGNALLPQTNLGVVTYMGERMLAHTEHSLLDVARLQPSEEQLTQMTAAMNAMHTHHRVPELDSERLRSVFVGSLDATLHEFGTMVGVATTPPIRLSQGIVSDMLEPAQSAREVVSGVFSFVKDQLATEPVQAHARQWREAVSDGKQDRDRNVFLHAIAQQMHKIWNAEGRPYPLPLRYAEVYGFDDRVRGLIVYERIPDEVLAS